MELKFSPATKPKAVDGISKQQAKLAKRIDEQIKILENHTAGLLPPKSWAWVDENGSLLVSIQYGYQPLELKKGMFALQCDSPKSASVALASVRNMVLKGNLDQQITKVSTEIRNKFRKNITP